jgi:hypothetical protein
MLRLIYFLVFLCAGTFIPASADIFSDLSRKDNSSSTQSMSKFVLCGSSCGQAKYYVGYNRTNQVNLEAKASSFPTKADTILSNVADASTNKTLPDVDERVVDREDGNFVSSIHRIDSLRIGFFRKSELMQVHTKLNNSFTKATVKLLWGDTFTVTSRSLQRGTPVKINLERNISGFGNPVTDYAYYQASSKTFINGKLVGGLDFSLKKDSAVGAKDIISGTDKMTYSFDAKVGDTFTVESIQEVVDGVNGIATSHQMLNGADSVEYKISLADRSKDTACLTSASGKFNAGRCQ